MQYPRRNPKKAKWTLAPWWLYIVLVILSLPFVIFLWALIFVLLHRTTHPGKGWPVLLDVVAWIVFMVGNRRDPALFRYLPASLLVLYGAIFITLFLLP